MPALAPPDVRAYLANVPPPQRAALLELRAQVLAAAPGARERISYKIPGFERDGRMIVWMAAFPGHCSFFGGHAAAQIARARPGKNYEVKGSTIRFAPEKGLPTALVKMIVKARLAENAERTATKKPAKKATKPQRTTPRSKKAA